MKNVNCVEFYTNVSDNYMNNRLETSNLIGQLEIMAAAAEPGMVLTETMYEVCSDVLLQTIAELKDRRKEMKKE